MFTPLAGNEANLVALYRCNEGGGSSVADSAPLGGSNNGAWVGTPVFVPAVVAPQAASDGGAARGDCSGTPGITEVNLDWRGQNVARVQSGPGLEPVRAFAASRRIARPFTTPICRRRRRAGGRF